MPNNNIIPIKNIYFMLCYAWNILAIKDDVKVAKDDFHDANNLLARVFLYGVGQLIKAGFHRSYIEKNEELSSLRGKIDIQSSIKQNTIQRRKMICVFDEYSKNDLFNQIIKYTINSLEKNKDVDIKIKKEIRKYDIFFNDIIPVAPSKIVKHKIIFTKNNNIYKMIIRVCSMLYENTIINEESGKNSFKDFFREEQMQKLFEIFLLNFYLINLDKKVYKVHAPKINWHIEEKAHDMWDDVFDVEEDIGDRRTDIVIENNMLKTQFILDAKYYQKTFAQSYMDPLGEGRIRTSHLNQVRGYIIDSDFKGTRIGALIYPMTNDDIKKGKVYPIEGANIIVKTINLNDNWKNIEMDLLEFVNKLEEPFKLDH